MGIRTMIRYFCISLLLWSSLYGVFSFPVSTGACLDRQYVIGDNCCNKCRPGYKVSRHCVTNADDGECVHCPEGTYNSNYTASDSCRYIDHCTKLHEIVKSPAPLDGTKNNECRCEDGYHYTDTRELCWKDSTCPPGEGHTEDGQCEVCPEGKYSTEESSTEKCQPQPVCSGPILVIGNTTTKKVCAETTSNPTPSMTVESTTFGIVPSNTTSSNGLSAGITVAIILVAILLSIGLLLAAYCCRKRCYDYKKCIRNTRRRRNGTTATEPSMVSQDSPQENRRANYTCVTSDEKLDNGGSTIAVGEYNATGSVVEFDGNGTATSLAIGNMNEVGMKELHKDVLRRLMGTFVSNLPWQKILDHMGDVFQGEDYSQIATIPNLSDYSRNRTLIYILLTKGPDAYDKFVKVLESPDLHSYNYLAKACRDKEQELLQQAGL